MKAFETNWENYLSELKERWYCQNQNFEWDRIRQKRPCKSYYNGFKADSPSNKILRQILSVSTAVNSSGKLDN